MSADPRTRPAAPDTRDAVVQAVQRRERRELAGRFRRMAILALAVLLVDQAIKELVRARLDPGDEVRLVPGLAIVRTTNEGIAFGLFPGRQGLVAVLTMVALAAIALALVGLARRHPLVAIGGGLLVGGSLGNLVDRVIHGGVTDYVDIASWPAFNLADVAIVAGAALIVWALLKDTPDTA
ncbi:MAG: signal peptidase II [Thermoleophilia bacterium]|nr:signal peptidase II [Thermoleophilia bacterium]